MATELTEVDPWVVAVHEAGHAVAAAFLEVPIAAVTIRPRSGRAGRMYYLDPKTVPPSEGAVIAWAGPLAERTLTDGDGGVRLDEECVEAIADFAAEGHV